MESTATVQLNRSWEVRVPQLAYRTSVPMQCARRSGSAISAALSGAILSSSPVFHSRRYGCPELALRNSIFRSNLMTPSVVVTACNATHERSG